ncbi:MAG: glycine oxidase ThiO [Vulcanimicrobiaceae bacterium]
MAQRTATAQAQGGDAIVIGAGLIGLSIAFELARRGVDVRVIESGEAGHGASWAAAGMLAPLTEQLIEPTFRKLCEDALAMYPEFVAHVREAGGIDPQLHLNGIATIAFDDAQMERLLLRSHVLQERGHAYTLLDPMQTLAMEPVLDKHVRGALLVHGEGQVNNRRLGPALLTACERSGVTISTAAHDVALVVNGRRAIGVRTETGLVTAKIVINAMGAWASQLPGVPSDCVPPVRPVCGQMLALTLPHQLVQHTVWVPGAYLVPKDDGQLLIGATSEDVGFQTRVTAQGVHALLHGALAAAPKLGEFTISETWAGLRPATPDELPLIGRTALDGYLLAVGHYRNGILLAPITAQMIADLVTKAEGAAPLEWK